MTDTLKPRLSSDFDGTAVVKAPFVSLANARKYPLAMVPRYDEFLLGFVEGGGELGDIITIRKERFRRRNTARSIGDHSLSQYWGGVDEVKFTGDEPGKAAALIEESLRPASGFIDDNPQKIGEELAALIAIGHPSGSSYTIGAVHHRNQTERLDELKLKASAIRGVDVDTTVDGSFDVVGPNMQLTVVEMGPYSHEEGEAFAAKIIANHFRHTA